MQPCEVTILESRLDWLTCTVKAGVKELGMHGWAARLQAEEVNRGEELSQFKLKGYLGTHAGRVSVGQRPDGTILQLQGDFADRHLAKALSLADNVSRADVAVTVRMVPFSTEVARQACEEYRAGGNGRGFKPHSWLIDHEPNGSTFYIGERTGQLCSRLYNKQAQSGEPSYQFAWRYELECKGDLARPVAARVAWAADRRGFCQGYVYEYYASRGVQPLYNATSECVHDFTEPRGTDTDRALRWLSATVAPMVGRLGHHVDRARLLDTLGLADQPTEGKT
jgi:DNA relaxase NicK